MRPPSDPPRPRGSAVLGRAWDGCSSLLQLHSCSWVSAGDLDETTECNFSGFSWILLFCGVEERSLLHVLLMGAAGRHCPAAGKISLGWNDFSSLKSLGRAEVKTSGQKNSIFHECEIWQRAGVRTACQRRDRQPAASSRSSPLRGAAGEVQLPNDSLRGRRRSCQAGESSGQPKPAQTCGKLLSGWKRSCPACINQTGAGHRRVWMSSGIPPPARPRSAPAWSPSCQGNVTSLGLHWVYLARFW